MTENYDVVVPLISAAFGGISNILAKKILKNVNLKDFVSINFFLLFLFITPFAFPSFYLVVNPYSLFLLFFVSLIDSFSNFFLFFAIRENEVSYVASLSSLSPIFSFIFVMLLIPSEFTSIKLAVVCITVTLSVLILNLEKDLPLSSMLKKENIFALFSAILFGLSSVFSKILLSNFVNVLTFYWVRSIVIALFFLFIFKPKLHSIMNKNLIQIVFRDIFVVLQWLLFYFSIQFSNLILAVTLSNTTPLFTLITARLFLNEKLTLKKLLASFLIVLSIFYVQL